MVACICTLLILIAEYYLIYPFLLYPECIHSSIDGHLRNF